MRSIRRIRRRDLLGASAAAGAAALALPAIAQDRSPNEKLSIAGIGVGGQGGWDIGNCASENIVALCDVDDRRCESTVQRFPKAKRYRDFRKMLDEMGSQIDAVVVGTPDHTHAPAAVMAMRMGKHCYCEKPLAHCGLRGPHAWPRSPRRRSWPRRWARRSTPRRITAAWWSWCSAGAIGPVGEVHVWLGANFDGPAKPVGGRQPDAPRKRRRCPARSTGTSGSARRRTGRTIRPTCPFQWRCWWAFGNGALGDFFCHYCDLAFWALELRHPTTVEAEGPVHPESTAQLDDRPLGVPGPRRPAAGQADLVRRRRASGLGQGEEHSRTGPAPCCSSAPKGC